ncbi:MBL fold metallo-hydrolase [Cognatishimia activa]|uniref:Hydroxyacylglutathione hydrolase n=1 Tax=Cognatishimia activa TaxID=1715691 RepID=A0A0P1IUK6_9RHOB|nr:MBL fold metallo-hydrolase [Cognatishimia activa]CUJ29470.1 hydroxyacylglutathione hydrolase [Cognatishimia activa]CUK27235.1 hydroxyacylglutathione hydrolase [Cognatishimia activa]
MSAAELENAPKVGVPVELEPGVRMILAPNPSPMTYWGTNTFLLGQREITVIDPGPSSEPHLEAILKSLAPDQILKQIVVTHSHLDHSPLAADLSAKTGAKVIAFGDSSSGRSAAMRVLAQSGVIGGGEGVDEAFAPDEIVKDGDIIDIDGKNLRVIHTPGHMGNHISLAMDDICFTGDHIMGWASSLVSPPDGDLTDFMASCERLNQTKWRAFYPAHGAPITAPHDRLNWLISHRKSREVDILAELKKASADIPALTRAIYQDVNPKLIPAAERNVLAHLVDLHGRGLVVAQQGLEISATFALA